jgi:hypothetical protein
MELKLLNIAIGLEPPELGPLLDLLEIELGQFLQGVRRFVVALNFDFAVLPLRIKH